MSTQPDPSRAKAFTWVLAAYIAAILPALILGKYLWDQEYTLWLVIGIPDVLATVIIFAFSYFFGNSSFYDPYWSIIPIFIAGFLGYAGWNGGADEIRIVLAFALVSFWGIRLTYNWIRGWQGLHHQDWRYTDLKEKHGKWYWLVSFTGIHLMPTVLVYLGCLSLIPAMSESGRPFGWLDLLAAAYTLGAILIELIADEQLRNFRQSKKGVSLQTGLWKYSRHPNYFGETAFWWGLYFLGIAARPDYWWLIVGPLSITLLFHFISIPMIEERMIKRRPSYSEVIAKVPRWIPWKPGNKR